MSMQTDVKAKTLSTTGLAGIGATRVRGIYFVCGSGVGMVSLKDGGVSGAELLLINTPANTVGTGAMYIPIPGEGVLFRNDPYVTITTEAQITLFYG